jgi:hypothetical protein
MPRVLRQLTPAAAWSAAAAMFVAAVGMYHSMVAAHTEVAGFEKAIDDMQAHQHEVIDRLARIEQAETDIKEEQNRQREWRERIEYVAERDRIPRRRK